jgi:hypothetical protein
VACLVAQNIEKSFQTTNAAKPAASVLAAYRTPRKEHLHERPGLRRYARSALVICFWSLCFRDALPSAVDGEGSTHKTSHVMWVRQVRGPAPATTDRSRLEPRTPRA